jgi:hypothetical protein
MLTNAHGLLLRHVDVGIVSIFEFTTSSRHFAPLSSAISQHSPVKTVYDGQTEF